MKKFTLIYVTGARFYHYRDGVYKFIDENQLSRLLRDFLHTYQQDCWTLNLEKKYMDALEREAPYVERLDSDRNFINCTNGMLDLRIFELLPHSPSYYSSIQIPFDYDPNAVCPRFLQFLHEIFDGDTERIAVIQEFFGYCLTTETAAEKFLICIGAGGNGKSKLIECLVGIVGKENRSSVSLSDLNKPFARLDLVDKTLNYATESEIDGKGLNTEVLKSIVSGDEIRVERKFGESFPYKPFCKVVYAMNRLPFSQDRSDGYMRRLLIVPFNHAFDEDAADHQLSAKLTKEYPGVFIWALEGLKRLRENQFVFSHSEAIDAAVEEYRENINPVVQFVRENVVMGDAQDRVKNNTLYERFQIWCRENGHKRLMEMTKIRFNHELKLVLKTEGYNFGTGKSGDRYISGIQLKVEDELDFSELA